MSFRSLPQMSAAKLLRGCPCPNLSPNSYLTVAHKMTAGGPSQGRRACSALSMAADMATVEVAQQEEEEAGDLFASLRPFTESPVFVGVQVGVFSGACEFILCLWRMHV